MRARGRDQFLERHRELLARRLRQALLRPDGVPDHLHLDGLDALERRAAGPGSRWTCSPRTGTSRWSARGRPRRAPPSTRTSSTTPMSTMRCPRSGAAGVVDLPQRVDQDGARSVMRLLLRVDRDPKSRGGRGRARDRPAAPGRSERPTRCRGSDPPRTSAPAVVGRSPTHSHTLPASCSAPNGAAPAGWARDRHRPAPAGLGAVAPLGVEHLAPRPRRGRRRPAPPPSHSSPSGSLHRPPQLPRRPRAECHRVGELTSVAGWSASWSDSTAGAGSADRPLGRRGERPHLGRRRPASARSARDRRVTTRSPRRRPGDTRRRPAPRTRRAAGPPAYGRAARTRSVRARRRGKPIPPTAAGTSARAVSPACALGQASPYPDRG